MDLGINKDNQKQEEKFANVNELPKTEAFQDEFTREFLVSTEEVEEGYYLMESKTGGYRMFFPTNAVINGKGFYYIDAENTRETIHISGRYNDENIDYFIQISYENVDATNDIEFNLDFIASMHDFEEEFEEYTVNGNTVYFGEYVHDTNHLVEGSFYYVFLGYIKSQNTDQAISISYHSTCYDDSLHCNLDKDVEWQKAKKIFESIDFQE